MTQTITVEYAAHLRSPRVPMKERTAPTQAALPEGRVPRVARLMSLAIQIERLFEEGTVTNRAELARLGHVTGARVTQILNLLSLAPDIQEEILFLPPQRGRWITESRLRPLLRTVLWSEQRWRWAELKRSLGVNAQATASEEIGAPTEEAIGGNSGLVHVESDPRGSNGNS